MESLKNILAWAEANPVYWLPFFILQVFLMGVATGKGWFSDDHPLLVFLYIIIGCCLLALLAVFTVLLKYLVADPWQAIRPDIFWKLYLTDEFKGFPEWQLKRLHKFKRRGNSIKDKLEAFRMEKIKRMNPLPDEEE